MEPHDLFDIPADLDTPVGAFLKLEPLEPRFLLESVTGAETLARYSFVGLAGGLEVTLRDGTLQIGDEQRPAPARSAELLTALREALDRAPRPGGALTAQPFGELPFLGGLVGVCGFDLARRLLRRPNQPPRAHAGLEAGFLAPRSVLVFDHATRRAALLHDGPEGERAALKREVRRLLRGPIPEQGRGAGFTPPQEVGGRDRFIAGVAAARSAIRDGDVYQLVLSEGFQGDCDVDPVAAYRALRLLNPSPYMYCLRIAGRTIVGSSPEVLCAMDGRQARLRPIAGTRPRGAGREQDLALERELLADPKENAEHVMLVDLARNDLGRVAEPGSVQVRPSRIIERYSHVMHMVSGVVGAVEEPYDQFDLFASSFPAGTVSGAPKTRALELIDELEPEPRGLYAGTVGYFGHGPAGGRMDQAITIRTMEFGDGTYRYRAGAGIVADSDPEQEHDEVLAKARVLHRALTLASEEL